MRKRNRILIERVKDAKGKERSAVLCAISRAVLPDGRVLHTEAAMEGEIAKEAAGNGGFGYDPILWLPEYGQKRQQSSRWRRKPYQPPGARRWSG